MRMHDLSILLVQNKVLQKQFEYLRGVNNTYEVQNFTPWKILRLSLGNFEQMLRKNILLVQNGLDQTINPR